MSDKRLDSDISLEREQLRDTLGEGFEGEILGYGVMYTVGADWNCLVPRDWLLDRINDLGIPQWVAPAQTASHYAYDRAIKWMREDWLEEYEIEAPRLDNGVPEKHRVTVDLKEGDGSRMWHARAEVFFSEEECKQDGGKWIRHDLGYFTYDTENKQFLTRKDDDLGENDLLYEVWEDISEGGKHLFERMKETHIAQDIRKMMYYSTRDYTNNVIQLRRSVYLFPAGMAEFVDKMATLYSEIDEKFKRKGEPVAVRTFEVLNTEDKREWVQHRVEQTLEENVEKILNEGFNKFDEGETADVVVKAIKERLGDDTETAETYNALLETEIEIEEALEQQKRKLANDEKEEIVERVMSQTDLDQF